MPEISVLLPVHNGMLHLPEAVESVLSQTFTDFECILIDDGSDDGSLAYIQSLSDERVRVQIHKQRKGLADSLNEAIQLAQGTYIARMDADDICHPQRFAKQVAFLKTNPGIDICGTWARTFGEGPEQLWKYPLSDAQIKTEMLFASVLVHSSVMLRTASVQTLNLRYDESLPAAQDYELWVRIQENVTFANLPHFLTHYRIHPQQVGGTLAAAQQQVADQVRSSQLQRLEVPNSPVEFALHNQIARWDFGPEIEALDAIEAWLLKLDAANLQSNFFDQAALGLTLEQRWWAACRSHTQQGSSVWRRYKASPLARAGRRSLKDKTIFAAKSAAYSLGISR